MTSRHRGGLCAAVALLVTGCSALTGFGDLAFEATTVDGGRVDLGRRLDGAAAESAVAEDASRDATVLDGSRPDGRVPPSEGGPPMDVGPPPPMDGGPPPEDLGPPPPMDGGPAPEDSGMTDPFDAGPEPLDTSVVVCTDDAQCDDLDPCTADECSAGDCVHGPASGGLCDDGDRCTTPDECRDGRCIGLGPAPCFGGSSCSVASCDPMTGCGVTPVPMGTVCDDGDPCSTRSECNGSGACVATATCPPDENPCTVEMCDVGGCVSVNVADDSPCTGGRCCAGVCVDVTTDDAHCGTCAISCNGSTSCFGGICGTCGADPDCNDGVTCTTDRCVSSTCQNDVTAGFCRIGGACISAGTLNPANPCQSCRPTIQVTQWSNVVDGTACNDGAFCTQTDTCSSGTCTGAGNPCDAMDPPPCGELLCNEPMDRCAIVGGCGLGMICCGGDHCTRPINCL